MTTSKARNGRVPLRALRHKHEGKKHGRGSERAKPDGGGLYDNEQRLKGVYT